MLMLCGIMGAAQTAEMDEYLAISPDDRQLLSKAVEMVDMGLSEAMIPDFDALAGRYPDNYLVQYERLYNLYNLYNLGRYDEVLKKEKFILGHKNSSELAYQLIGNSYDLSCSAKAVVSVPCRYTTPTVPSA